MENETNENQIIKLKGGQANTELWIQLAIIAILLLAVGYNTGKIYGSPETGYATGIATVSASEIIPTGIPAIYGSDLGISYDAVNANDPRSADATINVMKKLDQTLTLEGENLNRYITILTKISCEYCCGAKSIIFEDGSAACGCAHSFAMRGLGKYLILNHPEMSDDDILSELGKWKVLFFPGIHEQKAQVLESQGIDSTNYINLASNAYRGIEKGQSSSGGMVGGC